MVFFLPVNFQLQPCPQQRDNHYCGFAAVMLPREYILDGTLLFDETDVNRCGSELCTLVQERNESMEDVARCGLCQVRAWWVNDNHD